MAIKRSRIRVGPGLEEIKIGCNLLTFCVIDYIL
jgi:hypothetical protein